MSDIPDDIRQRAYELAYAWAMPDEAALNGATEAIAVAPLAERRRGKGAIAVERSRAEGAILVAQQALDEARKHINLIAELKAIADSRETKHEQTRLTPCARI